MKQCKMNQQRRGYAGILDSQVIIFRKAWEIFAYIQLENLHLEELKLISA